MSIGKLTALTVAGDSAIALTWDDGTTAQVDLADYGDSALTVC